MDLQPTEEWIVTGGPNDIWMLLLSMVLRQPVEFYIAGDKYSHSAVITSVELQEQPNEWVLKGYRRSDGKVFTANYNTQKKTGLFKFEND